MGELSLVPEYELYSNFPDSASRLIKLIQGNFIFLYFFNKKIFRRR